MASPSGCTRYREQLTQLGVGGYGNGLFEVPDEGSAVVVGDGVGGYQPEVLALGVDAQAESGGAVGRFVGAGGLLALGQLDGGRAAAVDEFVFEQLHRAPG